MSNDDLITSLLIDLIIFGILMLGATIGADLFGIQIQVPM